MVIKKEAFFIKSINPNQLSITVGLRVYIYLLAVFLYTDFSSITSRKKKKRSPLKPYKFLSLSSKGINEIGTIVVELTLYFSRSESKFSQLISSAHFSVGWFSENILIVDNLVILNTYLHASAQEQCGESIYWLLLRVKGLMKQGKSTGICGIIILMLPKSIKKILCVYWRGPNGKGIIILDSIRRINGTKIQNGKKC